MAEPVEYFATIDEIGVDFELDGVKTTIELEKTVLSCRGTWALVMFVAAIRDRDGSYKTKVMFHRYRKIGGGWRKSSSVNMPPDQLMRAARSTAQYLADMDAAI